MSLNNMEFANLYGKSNIKSFKDSKESSEKFDCREFEEKRRTLSFYEIADILLNVLGEDLNKEEFEEKFVDYFNKNKKKSFQSYKDYINYLLTCRYDIDLFLNEKFFNYLKEYAFDFVVKEGLPYFSNFIFEACEISGYKLNKYENKYTICEDAGIIKKISREIFEFNTDSENSKYHFLLITLRSYLAELGLGGGA